MHVITKIKKNIFFLHLTHSSFSAPVLWRADLAPPPQNKKAFKINFFFPFSVFIFYFFIEFLDSVTGGTHEWHDSSSSDETNPVGSNSIRTLISPRSSFSVGCSSLSDKNSGLLSPTTVIRSVSEITARPIKFCRVTAFLKNRKAFRNFFFLFFFIFFFSGE